MRARRLSLLIRPLSAVLLSCQQTVAWPAVKQRVRTEFPAVAQLPVAELATWLESGEAPPLLLDVREEAEYRVSHLRGAVRIDPIGSAAGSDPVLPAGTPKDARIVAYCSVGYRSSALAARLREQGYTRVQNLEGSIFEWANQGLPVVRDGRKVRQVHPYSPEWESLLAADLRAYSTR